jgi:rRNA-processing protein EBP2
LTQENEDDIFDVALEDAETTAKKDRDSRRASAKGKPQFKRQKRDEKFGYGGKKRFAKSNDAASTSDMRGYSAKKMKGNAKTATRPGKARRAKTRV